MTDTMRRAFGLILIAAIGALVYFTWGQGDDGSAEIAAGVGFTLALVFGVVGVLTLAYELLRPRP